MNLGGKKKTGKVTEEKDVLSFPLVLQEQLQGRFCSAFVMLGQARLAATGID